jgi:phosphoglycerol transferase MdoB-like AlkP superfamily enzyme
MLQFILQNPILVLAIIGATITFIASVTQNVAAKRPRRLLAILAALGFVVLLVQQLLQFGRQKDAALLEESRDRLIEQINLGVIETRGLVQLVAHRLEATPLAESSVPNFV